MDPEMAKRFQQVVDKGVHAEMCQVSMKLYNKTLDNLAKGFVATLHPVAVKRIADLQQQGYLYIKPYTDSSARGGPGLPWSRLV